MQCSCCECKAKYEVGSDYACGRHLAHVVDMHCDFPPHQVKVEKVSSKEAKHD